MYCGISKAAFAKIHPDMTMTSVAITGTRNRARDPSHCRMRVLPSASDPDIVAHVRSFFLGLFVPGIGHGLLEQILSVEPDLDEFA